MNSDRTMRHRLEGPTPQKPADSAGADRGTRGLSDPRAVDTLTTEHWSLLTARTLGHQEMFGRTQSSPVPSRAI